MKKLLFVLLVPVFACATELWSELYSESVYRSEVQSMKDTYYGTVAVGVSFSKLDIYAISHRYMLTSDGCFDVGPGIRKPVQLHSLFLSPFGEILFQKDSDVGVKVGVLACYRRKL